MVETVLPTESEELALLLEAIPNGPAVFLLWPAEGRPYLARTNVLRRRLSRLLEPKDGASGALSLRGTAERLEYHLAGSKLESRFIHLELARRHLGPDYRREIRLRLPPYVKLLLANEFPRTQIVTRLSRSFRGERSAAIDPSVSEAEGAVRGGRTALSLAKAPVPSRLSKRVAKRDEMSGAGQSEINVAGRSAAARSLYVGPFRNRSTAAQFESAFLDLFQLRRCMEDLVPSPAHPGCIYGEMGRCLRPCQAAVSVEEYRSEAGRVAEFLRTGGRSLLASASGERERLSSDMDFEGAARAHQRFQKVEEVLGWRDEIARSVEELHAIAIVASRQSPQPESISLGWLRGGFWQGFRSLDFNTADDGRAVSLDSRLREMASNIPARCDASAMERMEQLAVLSRWFYSSWCDGELLMVDDWDKIPWRKLVNAVSRVAAAQRKPRPNTHS